ncbi:MAG: F0F1 ATP synthase subunit gamma [Candidatus Levybacteria bacterium]|nr:F0F1 ATP synthase subunit gamma [Candidatus Levybacteria bacterium]
MQSHKLKQEIETVESFRFLAQAYEEISVIKMQGVRSLVLKTRDFLEGISDVFYDVKSSYKQQIALLMKKKQSSEAGLGFARKNGKSIAVLLSANTKLYGDIVPRTFSLFIETIAKGESDICIVGKLGRELYKETETKRPYTYFEIPDTKIIFDDLKPVVAQIFPYEEVTVFYGKFVNVINQTPTAASISGEKTFATQEEGQPQVETRFLFEPTLEKVLQFFESQIFSALFKQSVHESQLARHASRIRAMESALENIHDHLQGLQAQEKKLKRLLLGKKQNDALAGISLWGG